MNLNKNPLVSIFILCYNHEKYVAEAIQSVINQTYSNIEIIIVDNASTDNSKTIIESFVLQDKRIKFFPMEYNTLPSYGSNYAIKQCHGEYIAALSADDFFELRKIQVQLEHMINFSLDISFTWINTVNSKSELIESTLTEQWFNRNGVQSKVDILKLYLEYKNVTNATTVMLKKDFLSHDEFYDHRLLQTQDYDLWIKLLSKTDNIDILQKKLTNYRILDGEMNLSLNKSNIRINRTHFESIYLFKKFIDYPNELLSVLLQTEVNNANKLKCLYDFFLQKQNIYGQFAILLYAYENLPKNCDIQTDEFQFFFNHYGTLDLRFLESCTFFEAENNFLKNSLAEKDIWIAELQQGKNWLEQQVKTCTSAIQQKDNEFSKIKNSLSYKLLNKLGLIP